MRYHNSTLENTEGTIKKDNLEKLATQGTQDEKTQNTICVGHHYIQTNTNHTSSMHMSVFFECLHTGRKSTATDKF